MINTAAASVPAWCEQHQDAARAINVPTQLLTTLQRRGGSPLLIHISTDQVYSGNDPPQGGWRETDAPAPVNTYGRTKLEAEQAVKVDWEGSRFWVGSASVAGRPGKDQGPLSYGPSPPTAQAGWSNHVILRPSIIVGPEPPQPIDRPLFLSQILRSFAQQVGRGAGSKACLCRVFSAAMPWRSPSMLGQPGRSSAAFAEARDLFHRRVEVAGGGGRHLPGVRGPDSPAARSAAAPVRKWEHGGAANVAHRGSAPRVGSLHALMGPPRPRAHLSPTRHVVGFSTWVGRRG